MTAAATILVVDDEESIRFFLSEMLAGDGYEVVAVASGEEALARIAEREFDLALVDLKLEGISGLDVLQAIRDQTPDTVVVVLTAHASLQTAVAALRQGAHDYLFKPCRSVELRESVREGLLKRHERLKRRNVLQRLEEGLDQGLQQAIDELSTDSSEQADRFLHRGELIVDLMRHFITLNGHLLELSPTEFSVLSYLASEAPRVISSQELVREVQGYELHSEQASDIVRYHIYRIRRKAQEATGRTDLIRTVRGVGYALGNEYL